MAGKKTERKGGSAPREVSLVVDGERVEINGFVMDAFCEVLVGLVRSLGSEDATRRIEVTIGAQRER